MIKSQKQVSSEINDIASGYLQNKIALLKSNSGNYNLQEVTYRLTVVAEELDSLNPKMAAKADILLGIIDKGI